MTVLTDPYDSGMTGFKFPKVEAQVVTISHSHPDHSMKEVVEGNPFVINSPGEYEIKGVSVFGIATFHDNASGSQRGGNTVFVIEVDGVKVCHLGDLGHRLSEEQVEQINSVDVVLVPTGGFYTIGPKEAAAVVGQIDPATVIPMHYKSQGLASPLADKLLSVDDFLKEMGVSPTVLPKAVISKEKSSGESQVIVLERKS